jgi:hypothetical protein
MAHEFAPANIAPVAEEAPEDIVPRANAELARELSRFGSRVDAVLEGEPVPEDSDPRLSRNSVVFPDGSSLQIGREEERDPRQFMNPAERGNYERMLAAGMRPDADAGFQRGANVPQVIATQFSITGKTWPLP